MQLHEHTAVELAELVRRRQVSPVEVVEHFLARVERHDRRLGAFVTVTAERALDQAGELAGRLARGESAGGLAGVPTAIKDLVPTAGVRTTFGSAAFAEHVPDRDAHVVTRLRAAGLVSLGKSNTPEFGIPCYTEPDVAPPARTPWAPSCSASGSSGGAAAAVAAGLVPVAHGNDGGGSVRTPASVCGLVGFKPSRGLVSNGPAGGDVAGLATHGVLARTVGDAAAVLDAMAGAMPGDPWPAVPVGPGELSSAATVQPPTLRIGCSSEPVLADVALDPEVRRGYDSALTLLDSLGHHLQELPAPFPASVVPAFEVVWAAGPAAVPVPEPGERVLRPLTAWMRRRGAGYSAVELLGALGRLHDAARAALAALADVDVVVTPTLAALPRAVGELREDADPAADFEAQKRFSPFCAPYNVSGQPAVSLPLHWTDAGLPVGVQLVGKPGADALLMSLAAALERARPWRGRYPPQW